MQNMMRINHAGKKVVQMLNRYLYDILGDLEYDYAILNAHLETISINAPQANILDWLREITPNFNVTPAKHDYNSPLYNTTEAMFLALRRVALEWGD